KFSDALITDPNQAAQQTLAIINGYVVSVDGTEVPIEAQTLCIHSDTPNAVSIAEAVKQSIQ
ncbi:MAG: hypothetical protein CMG10_01515, partial [Candidatus Marinimicrobia bacterium]|nr:hypothetical protein [Candidatus Neomarinimicrobiota bacterium]